MGVRGRFSRKEPPGEKMIETWRLNEVPNINYAWAGLMVEELVRNGVTCFCIAPGSRSSALTVSAAVHPAVRSVVHYDERGLAFYALGLASSTGRPAVLICSSGTAVANFFPAVVEASKKKVPLILLTADRPWELQNTGALQTIDQVKIYGNYVRWQTDVPAPGGEINPVTVLTTIDHAVFRALDPMAGPVHLNCMFREPLAPIKKDFDSTHYFSPVSDWMAGNHVYTRYTGGKTASDFPGDQALISVINSARNGAIVVGKLAGRREREGVLRLAEKLGWPVFPDIVSGLRWHSHQNIIHYYDHVLLSDSFPSRFPLDTVLHIGGRITSKRWYLYLEKHKPAQTIMVLSHSLRNDPLHQVTIRVKSGVPGFVDSVLPAVDSRPPSQCLLFLREASGMVDRVFDDFMTASPSVSEIGVARVISKSIPAGHGLFLSNSMPVREMDMVGACSGNSVTIGGNRGASGIDGIIASACGFAQGVGKPTTLLVGDLAFLHDLNSLPLVKKCGEPVIIVVLNNDGGGIFSFLPIAGSQVQPAIFNRFFGTPHGLEFSAAARMFGLDYHTPGSLQEFETAYKRALESTGSTILEIKTSREENYMLHKNLQDKIKTQIDGITMNDE